jgi:hypothetical protein
MGLHEPYLGIKFTLKAMMFLVFEMAVWKGVYKGNKKFKR